MVKSYKRDPKAPPVKDTMEKNKIKTDMIKTSEDKEYQDYLLNRKVKNYHRWFMKYFVKPSRRGKL